MDLLSDTWHGSYAYPRQWPDNGLWPDNDFVATLLQTGPTLTGAVHEVCSHGPLKGRLLHARLQGSRNAARVRFVKTYDPDELPQPRPPIFYEGTLNGDASEIAGFWRIGTLAPGRFLMLRANRRAFSVARRRRVSIGAER
jgi:hypothetical protein